MFPSECPDSDREGNRVESVRGENPGKRPEQVHAHRRRQSHVWNIQVSLNLLHDALHRVEQGKHPLKDCVLEVFKLFSLV